MILYIRHVPVTLRSAGCAIGAQRQGVSRRQLADTLPYRARGRNISEREIVPDRLKIRLTIDAAACAQRFDLGREIGALAVGKIVERLNAHAIADEVQLLAVPIPDGKSEHSIQIAHAFHAEAL